MKPEERYFLHSDRLSAVVPTKMHIFSLSAHKPGAAKFKLIHPEPETGFI